MMDILRVGIVCAGIFKAVEIVVLLRLFDLENQGGSAGNRSDASRSDADGHARSAAPFYRKLDDWIEGLSLAKAAIGCFDDLFLKFGFPLDGFEQGAGGLGDADVCGS